ncbi:acyltransferase [Streptomyces sp. SID13726]|uniref:acyltransferase family protein n=1 Tax=Streptomyces sp. SID13726 TaxID=2706058 RepID=UPI0013B88352|nr:acyltransferase [Streptomyces sp. SID13726]NEB00343.1 acyltransferase [Streptomyces sp. SID13726]
MTKAPDTTAATEHAPGRADTADTADGVRRAAAPAASRAGRGFPSATVRSGRVNGLDGLRTLAVALVLAYHVDPDLVPGGSVAVDLFFTISGFVITRLLLAEYARSGGIGLFAFYRRRWLRLVPALLALCAVCAVLVATTTLLGREATLGSAGLAATFLTNVVRALEPGTYSNAIGPFAHTWSLGVEEQFYLLWPLVLLVLLRRLRARTVLLCTAALCVLPLLWRCVLWNPDAAHRIYNGTDTRADQLLAGALVAVVLARLRTDDPRLARLRTWAGRLALPALGLLALVAWQVPITGDSGALTAFWYTGGFLLVALLSATLVAGLELRPDSRLSQVLSLAPLAWVGRNLSYGMYLWHYPVVRLLGSLGLEDGQLAATVVLTVLMALLSYYAIEKPFLRRAHRSRSPRPAPAVPGVAVAPNSTIG